MKNIVFLLLLSFATSVSAIERSGIGVGLESDYMLQDRFKLYMVKAENGHAKAQYTVGEMLEKGRGTQVDTKGAYSWYKKAANQRHLKAQFKLGYMHYKGLGVEKDIKKAFEHLQRPANKGNVRAQFYLGKLYATGQGVAHNSKKALMWYSRASIGGYAPAEEELVIVKKLMADIDNSSEVARLSKQKKSPKKIKIAMASTTKKKPAPSAINVQASELNNVIADIQTGGWKNRRRPAEFLPSKITSCTKASSTIMECLSRKLLRNTGSADVVYITKALLYEINGSGEFKVAYRNNVLDVIVHEKDDDEDSEYSEEDADEDEESDSRPQRVTIKKGWQETEHQLECKIQAAGTINCVKNKIRKLQYKRKQNS